MMVPVLVSEVTCFMGKIRKYRIGRKVAKVLIYDNVSGYGRTLVQGIGKKDNFLNIVSIEDDCQEAITNCLSKMV